MPTESRQRDIHFVVVVWGRDYVDTFLNLALPSFLSPNNLPACAKAANLKFQVYTTDVDAKTIERHPLVRDLLRQCAELFVLPILTPVQFENRNRYAVMSFCHREAILDALRKKAILSILSPDCIAGDGSLAAAYQHIISGNQAVLVAGPRATLEIAAARLSEFKRSGGSLCVPNVELVGILMESLHPISQRLFWDAPKFSKIPSAVYWRAGPRSMLAKYFHLHPLLVDLAQAADSAADPEGTVDGPLLALARIPSSAVRVIDDSDDVTIIELSRLAHDWMGWERPFLRAAHVLRWAISTTDADHRLRFLRYDLRFRGGDGADFSRVFRDSRNDLRFLRFGFIAARRWPKLYECVDRLLAGAGRLSEFFRRLARRITKLPSA